MKDDWVNVFGIPKQIEGIRKFQNGDEIVYYDGDNGNYIKDVEPIPLTEEILEKNGFKKINQHDLFHIGTNRWKTDMWIKNNIIYIDSLRDDDTMISVTTCEYVHQFQLLLKDLEIEKEIVL